MTVDDDVDALVARHICTLRSAGAPPLLILLFQQVCDEDRRRKAMYNIGLRCMLLNVIGHDKIDVSMFDSLAVFRQQLADHGETTWPHLIDAVMEWKTSAAAAAGLSA